MQIPIEISARHIHLSKKDLAQLFGAGYQLKILKQLSQPGLFAAEETVALIGPNGRLEQVRAVGPCRAQTQVEISSTDCRLLGIAAPIRISGDLSGSAGLKIAGPQGAVDLREGVIVAQRHLHLNPDEAAKLEVKNNDLISMQVASQRGLIFQNIIARVAPEFRLVCHLDTDEGNAGGIASGETGKLVK